MRQLTAGLIVLPSDIERAVCDTLKAWVPYYLAEIDEAEDRARGTTKPPRFYDIASENRTRWREATPPSLLVVCPGTVGDPERHGKDAAYSAWWQVNVAATAGGATEAGTNELAGRLGGALYAALTQQADMGGLCQDAQWKGIRTGDIAVRQRAVSAVEVEVHVYVAKVIATRGPLIPRQPPTDPPAPADPIPSVEGSQITVTPEP